MSVACSCLFIASGRLEKVLSGGGRNFSEAVATLDVGVWRRRHLCVVRRRVRSYFGSRSPSGDAHRIR